MNWDWAEAKIGTAFSLPFLIAGKRCLVYGGIKWILDVLTVMIVWQTKKNQ